MTPPRNPTNETRESADGRQIPVHGPSVRWRRGKLRKRCIDCERWLDLESFGLRAGSATSRRSVCRACSAERERERRRKSRPKG